MEGDRSDWLDWLERHWRLWVLLFWLGTCAFLIYQRWGGIQWFALGDTDDNLRMAQVRALLDGQGWYDLRQYKLNPPFGADIHWSRLVDLPIAGIKLALTPFMGGKGAETAAVTVAPLLPMLVGMGALAVTVRRLLSPWAFLLALAILVCASSARGMWVPLRLDHHGWQLAMLAVAVAGLVDPRAARGGLTVGIATAVSFAIGLEMLLYLAAAGALVGLRWVLDRDQEPRLAAYGASLGGGCALAFLLFASQANRAPVCDALSPVWLSAMVLAGGLGLGLALFSPRSPWTRLAAAAAAAALLAAFYSLAWPHCLGRLEGASPELERLWLSKVREAMPIYNHGWRTVLTVATLPAIGLIGYAAMLWRHRRASADLMPWAAAAAPALLAMSLLLWQTRAGPAAQLLAVPGATGLGWLLISWAWKRWNWAGGLVAAVAAFLLVSGLPAQYVNRLFPPPPRKAHALAVDKANRTCPTLPALRPVALQPKGTVLTHVDLGPRLIATTQHNAIAGPYHRNGEDIVAVMRAFRGSAEEARRTVEQRRIDYVLICPNLSESTIYRSEAPKGFYVQLTRGQVPAWLEPVALPANSPYRMWRVRR
jgi:hypothetical protein